MAIKINYLCHVDNLRKLCDQYSFMSVLFTTGG